MEKYTAADNNSLKVLSSKTRIKIIKTLHRKQQTLSDLSIMLGLKPPTIKEHIALLEKEGIVKKIDEGRKWKYYTLTEKGIAILNPEGYKIVVASWILAFGAIGTAITGFYILMRGVASRLSAGAFEAAKTSIGGTKEAAYAFSLLTPLIFIVSVTLLTGSLLYILKHRKSKPII